MPLHCSWLIGSLAHGVALFALLLGARCPAQVAAPASQKPSPPPAVAPNFAPPKLQRPTEAMLQQIGQKTEELAGHCATLRARGVRDDLLCEIEVCLRAARNIVRLEEWYAAASGQWALDTLNLGLARATQALAGKPAWRDRPGEWNIRAYRSRVDDSIQPYAVLLPANYDPGRPGRLDVVLHGRDSSLTEAKFIATHAGPAPAPLTHVVLEVYGRGNNAYRWSGETDVFEALRAFDSEVTSPATQDNPSRGRFAVDPRRTVLRGFSMGGAGTWHIGLHHPTRFCLLGPGAGFTTTRGYVANLPDPLPPHVSDTLHIYDAVDCAENAFHVPIVAYSGEQDAQRQAAVNIEEALREFPEPLRFTHLVAPGLAHAWPPEWQAKCELEYRKFAEPGRTPADRIRFVLYTPRYGTCDWLQVDALRQTHHRALVEGTRHGNRFDLTTHNIRRLAIELSNPDQALQVTLDGQSLSTDGFDRTAHRRAWFEWEHDHWTGPLTPPQFASRPARQPDKRAALQGPIDDAFLSRFLVVPPRRAGWQPHLDQFVQARASHQATLWDRFFRGTWPAVEEQPESQLLDPSAHWVLFGDPASNPRIADLLPDLPITWTEHELVVAGTRYDATTHIPVLIYPNPRHPGQYVVLNSGHTFGENDLRGTNALLFPRLGDWAVLKPAPTSDNPHAFEVVASGLFDENWQFPGR
ncbi:MAG: hypothetical protein ACKOGA_09940 [Planctomycetaceae bacterium]